MPSTKAETNRLQNGNQAQVCRLLQLLKDLDHLEVQKHDYLVEYRKDRESLEEAIQKIRVEIESGQKELFASIGLEQVS